ncbi:thioredoxin family protein [Wukongibacter sp. M2B1]|uniref:thioredoxin family protein n=1 Tax=Wukongibacter sp. M2B1 TaxID=3088895 RepID=UPI003D78C9F2
MVDAVLTDLGLDDDFQIIADIPSLVKAGITATPTLMINGNLKFVGRIPSLSEVRKAIQEEI